MALSLSASMLDELRRFLEQGVSIIAVTSDHAGAPALTRCAAARLAEDGAVRVLVPMPEGSTALANIARNGRIALSCARPTTYRTLQIKGTDARRIEWPDSDAIARAHLVAFSSEVVPLGLPAMSGSRLWSPSALPIAFTPTELFDQSPGPSAGTPFVR